MADVRHGDEPSAVISTAPTTTGPRPPRHSRTRVVAGWCLTAGAVLVVVLVGQSLDVYFAIGGPGHVATEAQITRYEVTAVLCLALLVAGTVAAIAGQRPVLTVLGVVLCVLGVGVESVFAVPTGRWEREPPAPPAHDGPVCRSGGDSDDCLGG